jgi:hypothetical protein
MVENVSFEDSCQPPGQLGARTASKLLPGLVRFEEGLLHHVRRVAVTGAEFRSGQQM